MRSMDFRVIKCNCESLVIDGIFRYGLFSLLLCSIIDIGSLYSPGSWQHTFLNQIAGDGLERDVKRV